MVDDAYDYAKKLLKDKKAEVEKLVAVLLEKEVVTREEFEALLVK